MERDNCRNDSLAPGMDNVNVVCGGSANRKVMSRRKSVIGRLAGDIAMDEKMDAQKQHEQRRSREQLKRSILRSSRAGNGNKDKVIGAIYYEELRGMIESK